MPLLQTLYDLGSLPAYWYHCAHARKELKAQRTRIPYGPHSRQYALLFEPTGSQPTDPLPWAFYFHGGAWTFGSPRAFAPAARPWLEQGFRVVLPSYRRPPAAKLPDIVADCYGAIREVADFATRTGRPLLGPQIGGISAGGHLAALLALTPKRWREAGWPDGPGHALLCAAPLDLRLLSPSGIFKRYRTINPCEQPVPPGKLSFLILHGTDDGLVDYAHATTFVHHLTEHGGQARLLTIPGGGHLDVGRWTYDNTDPYASAIKEFIRSGVTAPPAAG